MPNVPPVRAYLMAFFGFPMKFVSTRGKSPALGFCDVVLKGLADDGGLYLPQTWPQISGKEIASFAGKPFHEISHTIISRFTEDEIDDADLRRMINAAYATFRHPSTTPLIELEPDHFILELFHGPTLAFKDVAMQFLARIMDHILVERDQRATIVGATSGDTGSAAIEAFRGRDNIDIFILHPKGRTSEVQRRQMTTVSEPNVHNIALEGTFDDCQTSVKAMFGNVSFRDAAKLSGVNSINWGRIVAQIVYYFKAAADLGAPHRPINFTVPTGNFGDIFAAFAAKSMGLKIGKLIIATNENDILDRTLKTGRYETGDVSSTSSPSMDIQISSNFERLLFEASGRRGPMITRLMDSLNQSGGFEVPEQVLAAIKEDFASGHASEFEVKETIATCYKNAGYLADPHTAVGIAVARHFNDLPGPMVTLATAHPAKFPDAVESATSLRPPLPHWLADLYDKQENYDIVENAQDKVEAYLKAKSRAWED